MRRGTAVLLLLLVAGCNSPAPQSGYATIQEAARQRDDLATAANHRGLKLAEGGDYDAAEAAFRQALTLSPRFPDAHNNLGVVYLLTRRYYEAAHEFALASKLAPGAAQPQQNTAILYRTIGMEEKAAAIEEALARSRPSQEPRSLHAQGP